MRQARPAILLSSLFSPLLLTSSSLFLFLSPISLPPLKSTSAADGPRPSSRDSSDARGRGRVRSAESGGRWRTEDAGQSALLRREQRERRPRQGGRLEGRGRRGERRCARHVAARTGAAPCMPTPPKHGKAASSLSFSIEADT